MNKENIPPLDEKMQAILQAAVSVFSLYGFKRTSMEDIAKAAGMSRAALYLHFKNKADIYGGLIEAYYARAAIDFETALNAAGTPAAQLLAGFQSVSGEGFIKLLSSPHGAELLDAKATAAGSAAAEGDAKLTAILAQWLAQRTETGEIDVASIGETPRQVAEVMMRAYYGLKAGPPDAETFVRERDQLARLYGAALTTSR